MAAEEGGAIGDGNEDAPHGRPTMDSRGNVPREGLLGDGAPGRAGEAKVLGAKVEMGADRWEMQLKAGEGPGWMQLPPMDAGMWIATVRLRRSLRDKALGDGAVTGEGWARRRNRGSGGPGFLPSPLPHYH